MEPKILEDKFNKIYAIMWGICLLVGIISIILYKSGYRLSKHLTPVKTGAIEITSNETDLKIFLNNREKNLVSKDGVYSIPKITPGVHSVIVDKKGYWPWTKTFSVVENEIRKLYVFTFPTDGIKTKVLDRNSKEYSYALKKIEDEKLPEMYYSANEKPDDRSLRSWIDEFAPDKKISKDQSTALYVEGDTIYVAWISETDAPPHYFCQENSCKLKMPIIIPNKTIKSVTFYKDRNDVILFASDSAIYAIEVDSEGTQNFQPIYKGDDPYFFEDSEGTLYIKEQNNIKSANL